ncbi:IS3 family transposase [Rhodobacteraceae bacterium M385]|nr:IS3 family transposase [Rhodobacteraceae bacterium M385]
MSTHFRSGFSDRPLWYLSRRGDDGEQRYAIKRSSRERRRFGCRRVHMKIAREGIIVNHKMVRRIYAEENLQVRRRGDRKRALGTRKPMVLPDGQKTTLELGFRIRCADRRASLPYLGGCR